MTAGFTTGKTVIKVMMENQYVSNSVRKWDQSTFYALKIIFKCEAAMK